MKKLLLLLIIVVSIASCATKSGHYNERKLVPAKVVNNNFLTIRASDAPYEIRYVDSLYQVGDVFWDHEDRASYKIIAIERGK